MTDRGEQFLKRFRDLEDILEKKYNGRRRGAASVVIEYGADNESLPIRERLTLCREIRNILTHSAEIGGETVVEPAPALLTMLEQVIEYARRPPLAMAFATLRDQLMWADLNQRALEVMRAMDKRGFSHVPVLQRGELVGVFSMGTVFSYQIRDEGKNPITQQTRIREFQPWLPIGNHTQECYDFIDAEATYPDVKLAFERIKRGGKRLAALFITRTGDPRESVLGMVTPWDALGQRGNDA